MIEFFKFAMSSWQTYIGSITLIAILGFFLVAIANSFKPFQSVKINKNDTGSWDALIESWKNKNPLIILT